MDLPEPFRWRGEHIEIALPGARGLFTTRRGGLSGPPFHSLNLGLLTADDPAAVRANRQRLADDLGVAFAYSRQVHGSQVHAVSAPSDPGATPEAGDGVVTATRGVAPLVLAADCVPVVIAGRGAVAAVHAGWRGLAEGVLAAAVTALQRLAPAAPRGGGLSAAIGPAAGPCCYEVSEELIDRFTALGHPQRHHGRRLDLKGIATDQLTAAGVDEVHDAGLCTICTDPALFYSHRRDGGRTGRQAGIGWLS